MTESMISSWRSAHSEVVAAAGQRTVMAAGLTSVVFVLPSVSTVIQFPQKLGVNRRLADKTAVEKSSN